VQKQTEMRDQISKKDFVNSHSALEIVDLSNAHIRYLTFCFFR